MTLEEQQHAEMLLKFAFQKAIQEAERKAIDEYANARDPEDHLRQRIYEAVACSASSVIDYQTNPQPRRAFPASMGGMELAAEPWSETQNKTMKRLQTDPIFYRLVCAQVNQIMAEVDRYVKGCRYAA